MNMKQQRVAPKTIKMNYNRYEWIEVYDKRKRRKSVRMKRTVHSRSTKQRQENLVRRGENKIECKKSSRKGKMGVNDDWTCYRVESQFFLYKRLFWD